MDTYTHDVAISCTQQDEPVARQLYDLLQARVKSIFLYTQNQKDLIGEDGVDAFSETYAKKSRVVVVIYREGWGKTNGLRSRIVPSSRSTSREAGSASSFTPPTAPHRRGYRRPISGPPLRRA